MPAPVPGVSLRDKQKLTRRLLLQGASIQELNAVRKRLSRLKGGGFARLADPAQVVALAISDVPGDDPAVIGSGPCCFEAGDAALARRVVRRRLSGDEIPDGVRRALNRRRLESTPGNSHTVVIGSGRTFAEAAGKTARKLGFRVHLRPDALEGEARVCGPNLVARFEALGPGGPHCLIATGETVVQVRGRGVGGRNQELALAAVPSLAELGAPTVLAALATDGVDGPSGASGGLVDDHTLALARETGVSISKALERNDSRSALRRLKALLVTGPTGTNVADVTLLVG
jgi:hydroxypyruvate reductase